jgi:hypothetical protein
MILFSTANDPKVIVTRNGRRKEGIGELFYEEWFSNTFPWCGVCVIPNTFMPRLNFCHPLDLWERPYRVGQISSGSKSNSAAISASMAGQGLFSAFPAAVAWYPWPRDTPERVLPRFFKAANTSAGCQSTFFGVGRAFMRRKFSLENRV